MFYISLLIGGIFFWGGEGGWGRLVQAEAEAEGRLVQTEAEVEGRLVKGEAQNRHKINCMARERQHTKHNITNTTHKHCDYKTDSA